MSKKILKIFGILLILIISCTTANAKSTGTEIEVPDTIRIGIYYSTSAVNSVELSSSTGLAVGVMVDDEFEYIDEVRPNKTITVTKGSKKGSVEVSGIGQIGSSDEYPYFMPIGDEEGIISINGTEYRGNVEIRRFSDSDMTVINHVSMQGYLYGVLPREIGGNSPMEALKAQAIVARTYAVKNYTKRQGLGFNLFPTTSDQAYGGYSWEQKNLNDTQKANVQKAVDETYGQVIVYDGELIGGYYFSTSGGYTESSVNVWGGAFDYLTAVPDYYEPEIAGNTTWEVELTADEIEDKLRSYNIDVGDIVDIVPSQYTDAGRVLELKIIGTDGTETIMRSKTREYLGLKSQWYTVNDDAPEVKEVDEDDLPSKTSNKKDSSSKKDSKEDDEVVTKNPNYNVDEDKYVIDTENMKPLLKQIVEAIIGKKDDQNVEEKTEEESKANLETSKATKESADEENEDGIITKNVKYESRNKTFVFRGRGWGHAVGMSQNGARGMAENGFTCEEIITWYYSGVEIVG